MCTDVVSLEQARLGRRLDGSSARVERDPDGSEWFTVRDAQGAIIAQAMVRRPFIPEGRE